jgi:hypothetical protein
VETHGVSVRRTTLGAAALVVLALLGADTRAAAATVDEAEQMWQSVHRRDAGFGKRAAPTLFLAGGPGFVAAGQIVVRDRVDGTAGPPAIWTSAYGTRWSRVDEDGDALGRRDEITSLARRGEILVALTETGRSIVSTDGRHWETGGQLPQVPAKTPGQEEREPDPFVASRPDGFIALMFDAERTRTRAVWSSHDGRAWVKERIKSGNGTNRVGMVPRAPLGDRWLATSPASDLNERTLFESTDGIRWSAVAGAMPPQPLAPAIAPTRNGRAVLAIQYEEAPSQSGGLWRSDDATTWTEITSFRRSMPYAMPDHLVRSGTWWVLGGISSRPGELKTWPSMWASPDLQQWYEMPKALRGKRNWARNLVEVYAANGRVLGYNAEKGRLWVWTEPD